MTMRLFGDVSFGGNAPQDIPKDSHLVVKFEDVSLADAPSVVIGETRVDAHEAYKNLKGGDEKKLAYSITCPRPNEPGHRYSVSAVLNIGWKASGDEWIRRGDYLTDTSHEVDIRNDKDSYKKDIEMVWYN